jgi:hypothetical protein
MRLTSSVNVFGAPRKIGLSFHFLVHFSSFYSMSLSKEKNSYTFEERQAALRIIYASEDWAEMCAGKRRRLTPTTMSLARTASGGASNDALHRWLIEDNSPENIAERLSRRGRKPSYSEDFKDIVVGYAISRRLDNKPVSAEDLMNFALGCFNISLRSQRVSEIMRDYGLSSQLSVPRNSRMVDYQVAEDCVKFILELRALLKLFPNLLFMDETGLWSNVVQRRTYHFSNQYEILSSSSLTRFSHSRHFDMHPFPLSSV